MSGITESVVEEACVEWFRALGYATAYGPDIGPDGDIGGAILVGGRDPRRSLARRRWHASIRTCRIWRWIRWSRRCCGRSLRTR